MARYVRQQITHQLISLLEVFHGKIESQLARFMQLMGPVPRESDGSCKDISQLSGLPTHPPRAVLSTLALA